MQAISADSSHAGFAGWKTASLLHSLRRPVSLAATTTQDRASSTGSSPVPPLVTVQTNKPHSQHWGKMSNKGVVNTAEQTGQSMPSHKGDALPLTRPLTSTSKSQAHLSNLPGWPASLRCSSGAWSTGVSSAVACLGARCCRGFLHSLHQKSPLGQIPDSCKPTLPTCTPAYEKRTSERAG